MRVLAQLFSLIAIFTSTIIFEHAIIETPTAQSQSVKTANAQQIEYDRRTWTSNKGTFSIEARFVSFEEGKVTAKKLRFPSND